MVFFSHLQQINRSPRGLFLPYGFQLLVDVSCYIGLLLPTSCKNISDSIQAQPAPPKVPKWQLAKRKDHLPLILFSFHELQNIPFWLMRSYSFWTCHQRKSFFFFGNHSTFNFSKKRKDFGCSKPRGSSFSRQSSLTWITSFPCCGSKLGISLGLERPPINGSMEDQWEASKGRIFFCHRIFFPRDERFRV